MSTSASVREDNIKSVCYTALSSHPPPYRTQVFAMRYGLIGISTWNKLCANPFYKLCKRCNQVRVLLHTRSPPTYCRTPKGERSQPRLHTRVIDKSSRKVILQCFPLLSEDGYIILPIKHHLTVRLHPLVEVAPQLSTSWPSRFCLKFSDTRHIRIRNLELKEPSPDNVSRSLL